MALAEGASGILFYIYKSQVWSLPEHPETWDAVKKVVSEMRDLEPLFLGKDVWWPLETKYADEKTGLNETLQGAITSVCLRVETGNESLTPGLYILSVNTTARRIHYQLRFPEKSEPTVNVLNERRAINLPDRWMTDDFDPYAVHIYGPLQ
jgi:hypothetical protein